MGMRAYIKLKIILVSILCFPVQGIAGWFGPDNFDECMVEEMKGQSKAAYPHVYKVCREKFPIEKPKKEKIPFTAGALEFTWKYGALNDGLYGELKPYIAITVETNRTGYKLTEVVAEFSEKNCESSINEDYKHKLTFSYLIRNSGSTYIENGQTFKCARIKELYGHK